MSDNNNIAIIGAGYAGNSLLTILLQIPGIHVKYISDINPDAPGMQLAHRNDIEVHHDPDSEIILNDPDIDVIFEVTGSNDVFEHLQKNKLPTVNIMCASMAKIIFFLLNAQQDIAGELREYKLKLAEKVIDRTDELELVNKQLKEQIDIQQSLNKKLQDINNEKTKYLVNATHQLKAPFAAIQSYVEILIDGYVDDLSEKVLKVMHKIKNRCIHLTDAIKQMLELANLNSAIEENIVMGIYHLGEITEKVMAAAAGQLEKKGITALLSGSSINDKVVCNPDQIETLIQILFDNAVNYSENNSTIEVTIDRDRRNRIILTVMDHGIGIEEQNLKKIFNEYFRSYKAAQKNVNGTGLGLAIARKIARLHQSEILVDSKPGEGSEFMVPFQQAEN